MNNTTITELNKAACSKCYDSSKHILTDNHHLVIEIFDIALNPRNITLNGKKIINAQTRS